MREIAVGELIFDYTVYPRVEIDSGHLGYMREAIEAGVEMPPIVAEWKSLRIADGFHRTKAYLALYGPEHKVDVVEKKYKSDQEFLTDAITLNANHGRNLTTYDRVHCLLIGEKYGLTVDQVALAMGMTVEKCTGLRLTRTAESRDSGLSIPLKRTIGHMAGRTLSIKQEEANKKIGGMNALFYINQICTLIENGLIDMGNKPVLERLVYLDGLIRGMGKRKVKSA